MSIVIGAIFGLFLMWTCIKAFRNPVHQLAVFFGLVTLHVLAMHLE